MNKLKWLRNLISRGGAQRPERSAINAYTGPDTALANYLQYYSTLEAPGYAVLVTGPWGVGKTYQVEQVIPESQRYYVSLYGLESVNAIHDAVLASCVPSMNIGGHLSTLGDVGKSMGDSYALAGLANSVWTVYLRQRLKPDRTIIFDDLERSSLWANGKSQLLGAINHYVEHLKFRVVVLCHDEGIGDELAKLKEKTFGHTVQATPQMEAAMGTFIQAIPDEKAKSFINARRHLIEEVWAQSGQSSLRILKHVISDVARLHSVLIPKHLENREAVEHLLRLFCALDIEVRAGNINRELLRKRTKPHSRAMALLAAGKGVPQTASKPSISIEEIDTRYPSSDITGTMLSDEIVEAMLIEGRFDSDSVAAWLEQTPYFIQVAEADPWRIVMNFDELDDATVSEGIDRMQKQFDERAVTDMGEFLHIAALRLMMAEQKVSGRTMEEEVGLCVQYIDDLLASGKLPPKPMSGATFDRLYNAYGGYAYWISDNSKSSFDAVFTHMERAREQARETSYPAVADQILKQVCEDPSSFFSTVSVTNSGGGELARVPILRYVSPKAFLDAWLSGSHSGWRQISMALDNRYELGQLNKDLSAEREWLGNLKHELDVRINEASGLAAFRLKRIKPKVFESLGGNT